MIVTPEEAGKIVKKGGVIIYPTETLYGIGGNPFNISVVTRIRKIKGREEEKRFILLVKEKMVYDLVEGINEKVEKLMKKFWPGPLTIIFLVKKSYRSFLGEKVAIRVSPHPVPDKIISVSGTPLISTSANLSGEAPVTDFNNLIDLFQGKVDAFVEGKIWYGEPSTIVDMVEQKILREGALKREDIEGLLGATLK